jgi:hypothetical protein
LRRAEHTSTLWVLGMAAIGACSRAESAGNEQTTSERRPLGVDRALLNELERTRGVSSERALELASEDALLARALESSEPRLALSIQRVALARALGRELFQEAVQSGPPTNAEVAELTAQRWWELDRPRLARVVHAVVLSETENAEARALAQRIANAVASAKNATEFEQAAKAVPNGALTVRVETPDPVALDGRAVDPDRPPAPGTTTDTFAPEFARAAQSLQEIGQQSPIVRSPFGYHVLQLIRVIDAYQPSLEERRTLLTPEIQQRRALEAQNALLARQRMEAVPQQRRAALELTGRLEVAR